MILRIVPPAMPRERLRSSHDYATALTKMHNHRMGHVMTIALPGSSRTGLSRLFGRRKEADQPALAAHPLGPRDIVRLFRAGKGRAPDQAIVPAGLNDRENQDIARLSSLRGALYSKD